MNKLDKLEKPLVIIVGIIILLLTIYMLTALSSETIDIPSSIPLGKPTSNVAIQINVKH